MYNRPSQFNDLLKSVRLCTNICWKSAPKRGIITESIEPTVSSTVPEKPCTLVLTEDKGLYNQSWTSLLQRLPKDYGIHFCCEKITLTSLKDALSDMQNDLRSFPSIVLVSRGPLVSLVAQYYLESLPLSGLIMVDPITDGCLETVEELIPLFAANGEKEEVSFLERISSGAEERPLKLERGVVPMLVVMTTESLQEASQKTLERHNDPDSLFGEVKLISLRQSDNDSLPELISNWIEDAVL